MKNYKKPEAEIIDLNVNEDIMNNLVDPSMGVDDGYGDGWED